MHILLGTRTNRLTNFSTVLNKLTWQMSQNLFRACVSTNSVVSRSSLAPVDFDFQCTSGTRRDLFNRTEAPTFSNSPHKPC